MEVVRTDRLILRWLEAVDARFIVKLLNQPSFLQYVGDRGVRSLQDGRDYIRTGPGQSYNEHGFGLNMVALKDEGTPIGMCGLLKRPTLEDVDLGFALLPEYWGQGYAFEAASATLAHGKTAFDLERIVAITAPDNEASIRLLEKLGMKFERMIQLTDDAPAARLFA